MALWLHLRTAAASTVRLRPLLLPAAVVVVVVVQQQLVQVLQQEVVTWTLRTGTPKSRERRG